MDITKAIKTNEKKARYISANFPLHRLFDLPEFHRNSPLVLEVLTLGLKLKNIEALGFGVPLATSGQYKGYPDALAYLNKLLRFHSRKISPVRQEMNDRARTNYYRVEFWDASDFAADDE